MKYSVLIRKLVNASEECKYQNTDIADRLKYRCVPNADIIRQTLMNAVCDPRFKMSIDSVPSWRQKAIQHLERFAQQLMMQSDLDDNYAQDMIDEMLIDWLSHVMEEEDLQRDAERIKETLPQKDLKKQELREMEEAIKEFCPPSGKPEMEDAAPDFPLIPNNDPDKPDGGDTGAAIPSRGSDAKESRNGKLDNKHNPEEEINRQDDEDDDQREIANDAPKLNHEESRHNGVGVGRGGQETSFQIETRFLSHVPKSLVDLAKLIGCAGDNVFDAPGAFHSASKSDITGVRMSDDISSMLPSELAIMSDADTRDVFYHRYATKRLQTFSSASHGRGRKIHHDGPIIICLDTSSSMCGEPIIVAKAVTIAIAIVAQRMKRNVLVVKYSDSHYVFDLQNISMQRTELMEYLSTMGMGGNDEDGMFKWLFGKILPEVPAYSSADILCISDFGWTSISNEVMSMIADEKFRGMTFYGLNIGDTRSGYYSLMAGRYGSPQSVCDSMWEYDNGLCSKMK